MTGDFKSLVDDQGIPIRIKAASIISILSALIAVGSLLSSAGAKNERLNDLTRRAIILEALPPRVDRLEAQMIEVQRRLESIEKKIDRLLERK